MTKDKALKQALEALNIVKLHFTQNRHVNDAIIELEQQIEPKYIMQRQWVGLTEEDFSAINQSCLTKLQAAMSAQSILKERNHG